jgi:hypothetical protein
MHHIHQIYLRIGGSVLPKGSIINGQKITYTSAHANSEGNGWDGSVSLEFNRGYKIQYLDGRIYRHPGTVQVVITIFDMGNREENEKLEKAAIEMNKFLQEHFLSDIAAKFVDSHYPATVEQMKFRAPSVTQVIASLKVAAVNKNLFIQPEIKNGVSVSSINESVDDGYQSIEIKVDNDFVVAISSDIHDSMRRMWYINAKVVGIGTVEEIIRRTSVALEFVEEMRGYLLEEFNELESDQYFRIGEIRYWTRIE